MSRTGFHRSSLAFAVLLALVPLGACGSPAEDDVAHICIDYVYFETPGDAVDDASAVVLGRVVERAGTGDFEGVDASIFTIAVDEWVESGTGPGAEQPEQIEVMSLPRTCGESGDALADAVGGDALYLFLREVDGQWETLTPFQGQIQPDGNGEIPSQWPGDIYD